MFSPDSRYFALPDVVAAETDGRVLASKSLRPLPEPVEALLHIVKQTDRLDHLAFTYYEQSRDWWRITDANPGHLSPQALLGKGPQVTMHVPVMWAGPAPPWSDLLNIIRGLVGVDEARFGTSAQPVASEQIVDRQKLTEIDPELTTALDDSVRAQAVTPALARALTANGIAFTGPLRAAKADTATWHLIELATRRSYTVRAPERELPLPVFESETRHRWTLLVSYNALTISHIELTEALEAAGAGTGFGTRVSQVGKPIVIPARV
jgi:hypothetical protein